MTNTQKMFTIIGFLAAVCLVVIVALAPRAALAQGMRLPVEVPCNKSEIVLKGLQDTYHEQVVGGGVTPGGGHIRLFVSEAASFTVIMTTPDGMSCILTGGDDWTTNAAKPMGSDS